MREFIWAGYVGNEDGIGINSCAENLTEAGGEDIRVTLVTEGGSVFVEKAVSALLKAYAGKKTAYIVGLVASAGTKLMLAFDEIEMDEDAYLMIHNPATWAIGDA